MDKGFLRRLLFFVTLVITLVGTHKTLAEVSAQNSSVREFASQKRLPGESWQQARERFYQQWDRQFPMAWSRDNAESVAVPFSQLNHNKVVTWGSEDELLTGFFQVRDQRDLDDPLQAPIFKRRLTWLYPDDGCYARAAMMKKYLSGRGYTEPTRIFIFGSLEVQTDNSPSGSVTWWYHTAPVVRIGGQVYVFDPAINPQGPTPVRDWVMAQTSDIDDVKLSYCAPSTYHPGSSCDKPAEYEDAEALSTMKSFLRYEWDRQIELNRDPAQILGEQPPW